MRTAPPFETFALEDAPAAASLTALAAAKAGQDQWFELYPEVLIEHPMKQFADLWHLPEGPPAYQRFEPGPMTSARVSVRAMHGALVHPRSGFVFDRQGRVLLETTGAEGFRDRSWTKIAPVVAEGARIARRIAIDATPKPPQRMTLYANHGGYTVFGHMMFETIPLALIFSNWLRAKRMRLLMPLTRSTAMPDGLLTLAGLDPSVQYRSAEPFVWRNHLIVSSTCSARSTFRPGPLHHDFARTIKATIPIAAGRRRLFLTRAGEQTTQRRDLVNERALMAALTPLGFEAVNPGLLPPRDQVALFAQAECLIALMGSAWANLIYARPDTLVVDLLPEHKAAIGDVFGLNVAKATALPYILILTQSRGVGAGNIDVIADVPLIVDRVTRGLKRVKDLRR